MALPLLLKFLDLFLDLLSRTFVFLDFLDSLLNLVCGDIGQLVRCLAHVELIVVLFLVCEPGFRLLFILAVKFLDQRFFHFNLRLLGFFGEDLSTVSDYDLLFGGA